MADPRFYSVAGPFTLRQLADIAGAEIGPGADPERSFSDVAAIETATASQVSFLDNKRYVDAFTRSAAGACLVEPQLAERAPKGMALLLTREPYRAYGKVAFAFYPAPAPAAGIDRAASIDPTATLGQGCRVEPGAVIGADAEIGPRCHIGANAVIGRGVKLGADCSVGATATLGYCLIGDRVLIHPGVRIGQDGFGFALGAAGHSKIPQLGRVIIGNDVEIGANTTIDRGAGPDTVIGDGTRIDNLVQIAHNVRIGRHCIIVSQVGISGSTRVGDFVMMGGQAGLAGHLSIGNGARVSAQAGVMRDVADGQTVAGSPAMPAKEFWRTVAAVSASTKKQKGS
jgi:UDP-3-O-[3-hydroxymyristoyl] glucosamine N-acyltransferase